VAEQKRIAAGTVVARSDEPVTAEVDGTVVMMSLGRGKYFGLDAVGTRVWELLEQPRSIAGICEALLSEYDVDAATCERDVIELVSELLGEELVRVVDEAAA
jgi:hypothetical protein